MKPEKHAGDNLLVVKRSHQFYLLPRMSKNSPLYSWSLWWGPWFIGRFSSTRPT